MEAPFFCMAKVSEWVYENPLSRYYIAKQEELMRGAFQIVPLILRGHS